MTSLLTHGLPLAVALTLARILAHCQACVRDVADIWRAAAGVVMSAWYDRRG